jgi:hypothetical protein
MPEVGFLTTIIVPEKIKSSKNENYIYNRPFQIVRTDILELLSIFNGEKKYILTFTDHFTK